GSNRLIDQRVHQHSFETRRTRPLDSSCPVGRWPALAIGRGALTAAQASAVMAFVGLSAASARIAIAVSLNSAGADVHIHWCDSRSYSWASRGAYTGRTDKTGTRNTTGSGFGAELRHLREAAGLTQDELAERAGLTSGAVSALERGQRRHPYPHTVRALAVALGLGEERVRALLGQTRRGAVLALGADAERDMGAIGTARRLVPLSSFVGRQQELGQIRELLTRTRMLTLVGVGGVGKTRLALEIARELGNVYPDGVSVAELAALTTG